MTANPRGVHTQGTEAASLFGRPFPLFLQSYIGGVDPWLMIPSFALFGPSMAVFRLTKLFWCSMSLLLCMLWTRKLLGLPAALLVALLLGLDTTFYFVSVLDWGQVVPSFLCRFCGFYLTIRWWRERRLRHGFLAAVCLGVGLFNKVDFAAILLGCGSAVAIIYGKEILASMRSSAGKWTLCGLGFVLFAAPMVFHIQTTLLDVGASWGSDLLKELPEKIKVVRAMYDGSYVFRLMNLGGTDRRLDMLFAPSCPVWSAFGWVVILSGIVLVLRLVRGGGTAAERQRSAFLLLGLALVTGSVFLLPGAVHIYHQAAVYPFPHLIVIAAIIMLWQKSPLGSFTKWTLRSCAVALAVLVIGGHLAAILRTQDLTAATGGRGWWSDAITTFCDDVKAEPGLSIVSLDWGFNEQIDFLCDPRQLSEPFWFKSQFVMTPKSLFLLHPPQYTLYRVGRDFYNVVRDKCRLNMSIQTYCDHQGQVEFHVLRVYGVGNISMQAYRSHLQRRSRSLPCTWMSVIRLRNATKKSRQPSPIFGGHSNPI